MGWRVSLTEQADHDKEDAVAFLAAKNQAAAERLGLDLVDSIFRLADFPLQGMPIRGRPGYRRILHRPWHLNFYRVDAASQIVEIVRIWDGRRNPSDLKLRPS